MLNFLQSPVSVGLELIFNNLKCAEVSLKNGKPNVLKLFSTSPQDTELADVKPLYMSHPLLVTGLEGCDVLVRTLQLPLTKEKDIDASLAFQAEPVLPYPIDQAILSHQILSKTTESSTLTLLSVRKDLLQKHLEQWQQFKIEPEKVGCIQTALCQFAQTYVPYEKPYLILHMNEAWMTCVLIKEGKLTAAYSMQEGLNTLKQAYEQNDDSETTFDELDLSHALDSISALQEGVKRLQQAVTKVCYALIKESKGEPVEGLLLTGDLVHFEGIANSITEKLNLTLLHPTDNSEVTNSSNELQHYAVPIGLAIGALQNSTDFRQQELSYPNPWKRLVTPLAGFFISMLLLTVAFYFFGQTYLQHQEDQVKQKYVDLLTAMNKPYDQFEQSFLQKNPLAKEKSNGEILAVTQLDRDDLLSRLEFIHKDLQGTPDSFPLFANIPRVSDVLAWLSNHPYVLHVNEDGTKEARLELENFSYVMLKRPVQGKKQEKYQVKVELEFSSETPKWAREFHDALITPNDFVDPKAEVKWSSNRGHYMTSFFLKDKTHYPN